MGIQISHNSSDALSRRKYSYRKIKFKVKEGKKW